MVDEAFNNNQATKILSKVNICHELYSEQSSFVKNFKVHVYKLSQYFLYHL